MIFECGFSQILVHRVPRLVTSFERRSFRPPSCSSRRRASRSSAGIAHGRHAVLETTAKYFHRLLLGFGRRLGKLAHVGQAFSNPSLAISVRRPATVSPPASAAIAFMVSWKTSACCAIRFRQLSYADRLTSMSASMFFFSMSINAVMSTPLIWQDSMSLAKSNPGKAPVGRRLTSICCRTFSSPSLVVGAVSFEASFTVEMLPHVDQARLAQDVPRRRARRM